MSKEINFDIVLAEATKLPIVRIDREEFLRTSLSKYFDADTVNTAISKSPAYAGIRVNEIAKIAKSCIDRKDFEQAEHWIRIIDQLTGNRNIDSTRGKILVRKVRRIDAANKEKS